MEQRKDRNFVCKFCSLRFPCGKSLGGHIRTHMNDNSADSDEDHEPNNKLKSCDNGGGQSSYGLRENPRKNKRFSDQTQMMGLQQHQQEQQNLLLCKDCGKGFSSRKALCGHMACHSDREKVVVMDSQSDTDETSSAAPIRRRSKRVMKHHRAFVGKLHQSNSSASFANVVINSSSASAASEVEQEQEELALCLMMLSRDSSFKKAVHHNFGNSVGESSDNNSVILETKSSSGELKIVNVKSVGGLYCNNADESFDRKKLESPNQLKSAVDDDDDDDGVLLLHDSDNSDSGYFRNGPKKVDSDVSVDGFLRNAGFNKAMMESGSGFDNSPAKQDKNLNRLRNAIEFRKESGRSSTKYDLRKSNRVCPYSRKKIKNSELNESVYDSGENSLEADSCSDINQNVPRESKIHRGSSSRKAPTAAVIYKKQAVAKKKSKGHECPICFRVFKSGQALGGHKRSHFIGNHENSTVVIQQNITEMHTMIDLNLPAPVDE